MLTRAVFEDPKWNFRMLDFDRDVQIGDTKAGPVLPALERWVEQGVAPARMFGSGRAIDDPSTPLTRPLCPYPQVAQYRGSGEVNDAANFACAAPSR